jgi:hypothetical protein
MASLTRKDALIESIINSLRSQPVANLEEILHFANGGTPALPDGDRAIGYTFEQWDKLVAKTVAQIGSLGKIKGGEYAHGGDRLDNFRRNGKDMELPMITIWRTYAGKHWDSITTFVKDVTHGRERPRSEPMSGRADDLIVYLILFKAMLEEMGVE